jgi:glycosyltransferase involved in cell wall biosynthesis
MTPARDVSVIIPTFERVSVLPRALDSVLAQTHAPAEVIVIDDGSTDGTAEMLEHTYPGVTVIRQPNRGVSAARNAGLAAASSAWIAFLDSDDEWRPRKLERQLDALLPAPDTTAPLVCHTEEIWIRDGRRVNPMDKHAKKGGWIFAHNLDMCRISPSAVLMHRSVLDAVGGFDEILPACEDYDLWLRITSRYPVHFVEEPLVVKYGGHEDQLSRRFWGMDRFRIRALEKILIAGHLDENQRREAARTLVRKVDIYLEGARKRGKQDEVDRYERKRDVWKKEAEA